MRSRRARVAGGYCRPARPDRTVRRMNAHLARLFAVFSRHRARTVALVALAHVVLPGAHAQDPVQQLLDHLGARAERRASFVERQYSPLLNAPLEASGRLHFRAPDELEKETLRPRHEWLRIRGDASTRSVRLSEQPVLSALIASLRATLAGDRATLQHYYEITLRGDAATRWTLTLTPIDPVLQAAIDRIEMRGRGDQVEQVMILSRAGDRSELSMTPVP